MLHEEDLKSVLQINQPARAEFCVESTSGSFLCKLFFAELANFLKRYAVTSVHEIVAKLLSPLAKGTITGDEAEPREGEFLVAVSVPFAAVVAVEAFKTHGMGAGIAIGTESQIQVKDAFPLGCDTSGRIGEEPLEELRVGYRFAAVG